MHLTNTQITKRTGLEGDAKRFWKQALLIEDNFSRAARSSEHLMGAAGETPEQIAVGLHSIRGKDLHRLASRPAGNPESEARKDLRIDLALSLLAGRPAGPPAVVTAGPDYGGSSRFLQGLAERGLDFAVEISSSRALHLPEGDAPPAGSLTGAELAAARVTRGGWSHVTVEHPVSGQPIVYAAVHLGRVRLHQGVTGWLTVLQTGAILNSTRGTAYILASRPQVDFEELIQVAGWVRWFGPYMRRLLRPASKGVAESSRQWSTRAIRAAVTERTSTRDLRTQSGGAPSTPGPSRGTFCGGGRNGPGLLPGGEPAAGPPSLLGRGSPRLRGDAPGATTLCLPPGSATREVLPEDTRAVDLRGTEAEVEVAAAARKAGGVDIVIGGPPCQGFSSANRHSWHGGNPHNLLIDTYLGYVTRLRPKMFVMENVQGIVSSPRAGQKDAPLSVLDYFAQQMTQAGYLVFPRLVDASLYGVPQRRNRCFIVGLHKDLGWDKGDFDSWGPFPPPTHGPGTDQPWVTVGEAIGDLPRIGNGEQRERQAYTTPPEVVRNSAFLRLMRSGEEQDVVTDHVTSRHADYVIERYRRIPAGGNWQDIRDQLTNYASAGRTHSNIYRRLDPDQPSITIGHYRKSMIVHPDQPRGLSLREAARLQSFPDWFRFAGAAPGAKGKAALGHKQQQLANAVCPLVTKALAEFLFGLLR